MIVHAHALVRIPVAVLVDDPEEIDGGPAAVAHALSLLKAAFHPNASPAPPALRLEANCKADAGYEWGEEVRCGPLEFRRHGIEWVAGNVTRVESDRRRAYAPNRG